MEVITETTPAAVRDKIADWLIYRANRDSTGDIRKFVLKLATELCSVPCIGEVLGDAVPEGATIKEAEILPDGSGFVTASMPLPKDHWLYGSASRPPMSFRMGKGPARDDFERRLREAGQYAVKAATTSGKDSDFDPDALIQNLIVGACGYHTATGLTEMGPEEAAVSDPIPVPPFYNDGMDDFKLGLSAAIALLSRLEPGDSRAVSNEFVSLASLEAGILNEEGREILRRVIVTNDRPHTINYQRSSRAVLARP